MKQLTLYPHNPWLIGYGITQLSFVNVNPIWQLVQYFQTGEGAVLSEKGKVCKNKDTVYVGDVATRFDYTQLYARLLRTTVGQHIDDIHLKELYEADRIIRQGVNQVLFMNDLPGEIDEEWDVQALLKYLNLRIETAEQRDFYGIIENVIDVAQRLSDDRLLVFVNAGVYLRDEQIQSLAYDAYMKHISCLFIERNATKHFIDGQGLKQIFIDQDFVEFVSDDAISE